MANAQSPASASRGAAPERKEKKNQVDKTRCEFQGISCRLSHLGHVTSLLPQFPFRGEFTPVLPAGRWSWGLGGVSICCSLGWAAEPCWVLRGEHGANPAPLHPPGPGGGRWMPLVFPKAVSPRAAPARLRSASSSLPANASAVQVARQAPGPGHRTLPSSLGTSKCSVGCFNPAAFCRRPLSKGMPAPLGWRPSVSARHGGETRSPREVRGSPGR